VDALRSVLETVDQLRASLEVLAAALEASTGQAAPDPESPIVLEYPVAGTGAAIWRLRQAQVDEWRTAFPGVDVEQECRTAYGWIVANKAKRKTVAGMPRFLNAWLSKAQNESGRRGPGLFTPKPAHRPWNPGAGAGEWICPHVDACNGQSQCRLSVALKRPERHDRAAYRLDEHGIPREM
jgi:hypothetical protein